MARTPPSIQNESASGPFFLGLALAVSLFLGGAVRTFLGPNQIRQFIQKEMSTRELKFNLTFESARLSLSEGWWPRLGLVLERVAIEAKSVCDNPGRLQIDNVYVPVYLWKLFNNQLKFKTIQFGSVEISHRGQSRDHCATAIVVESPPAEKISSVPARNESGSEPATEDRGLSNGKSAAQPGWMATHFDSVMEGFNRFIVTRWAKELKNTSVWLDGIEIQNLSLIGLLPKGFNVYFEDVDIEIDEGGELGYLTFKAKPSSQSIFYLPLENFDFEIVVDKKKLDLKVHTGFKEGRWSVTSMLKLETSELNLTSQVTNFPVTEIVQGLSKSGVLSNVGEYPRSVWLSCDQTLAGNLRNWREVAAKFSSCGIEGDLGRIIMEPVSIPLFKRESADILKFSIEKFSLRKFLEGLNVVGDLKRVVQKFGYLSGNLAVMSFGDVTLSGKVEEAALVFSKDGRRMAQEIEELSGSLRLREDRVSLKVNKARLENGAFRGQLSLNISRDFTEGYFQSNISELDFDPGIKRLLMNGGELSGIELYGRGEFSHQKLTAWSGVLGVNEFRNQDMVFQSVKTETDWVGNKLSGFIAVDSIVFGSDQPAYQLFQPLYLGELEPGDMIRWNQVGTKFSLTRGRVEWQEAKAIDKIKDVVFSSEGSWNKSSQLLGTVMVDFAKLKMLTWNLTGTPAKPQLTPTDRVLKQVAVDRPSLKEPIVVKMERQSSIFMLLDRLSENLQIQNLREKVVDSAKSLLPAETKADEQSPLQN